MRLRRRWRWVVAVAVAIAALVLVYDWYEDLDDADGRFPSRIVLSEVVEDLGGLPPADAIVRERHGDPVRVEGLQPGGYRGRRRALVAPPPAEIRRRVRVPADAALRLAVGVATDGTDVEGEPSGGGEGRTASQPGATAGNGTGGEPGTRFTVLVDGEVAYRRVIDPVGHRRARKWFDEEIPLDRYAGREVTLSLVTDAAEGEGEGEGAAPVGRAGWARVQLVRHTRRERQTAHPDAPNVLLLMVDTLRADVLGCYGASPSPSPVLDTLAGRGVVFDQAIANAPWTLPSVTSIFTGLHPRWHGVVGRSLLVGVPAGVAADADWAFLSDTVPTIASEAARAGITTFGVSSNALVSPENNLARGFERFVVLRSDWERTQWAPATAVHDTFLRWAGRNHDRRFFAYLHYMEPHEPYVPDATMAPPDDATLPADVRAGSVRQIADAIERGGPLLEARALDYLRARYVGAVHAWDRALDDLLRGLERLGLADRTIVVVTADHGEEFQEHGQLGHRRQLYDESLHVPLVVAGPGVGASRRGEQVQGIDVFPTIARLLGVPVPPGLPGRDVLGGERDERVALAETQYGIARGTANVELLALRRPGAKLIWAPALEHRELYDLTRDPGERVDRWSDGGGAALAGELEERRAIAPPPPPGTGSDPALVEKLRALGYLR